jgi:hypothetical protein
METENKEEKPQLIEDANKAAERIEKALAEMQKREAFIRLGGKTEAGSPAEVPIDPEVAKKERINKALKHTGFKI